MEIRDAQRYLVGGLARGVKELGWKVTVPAPYASVSVLPSLFNTETAKRLATYDQLQEQYFEWLQSLEPCSQRDMETDAGELLYSLVFHSGVTCRGWFSELSKAIGEGLEAHQGTYWLNLEKSKESSREGGRSDNETHRRRVILAPVTALLVRRWHRRWSAQWPRSLCDEQLLEAFIVHIGSRPMTWRECFATAEANLVTVVPGFLTHFARTLDLGKSLKPENWSRLITGQFCRTSSENQVEIGAHDDAYILTLKLSPPSKEPPGDQTPHFRRLETWMGRFARSLEKAAMLSVYDQRRLMVEFRHRSTKDIRKVTEPGDVSILVQMMAEYALYLICSDVGSAVDLLSQAKHFKKLHKLLDYSSDIHSAVTLDADEWQSIYEAISEASSGNDSDVQHALASWHEFLHKAYGVERVPSETSAGSGVDAAILTLTEFEIAKHHLLSTNNEFAQMQLALLILGFRCGLRRSETWSRRFVDFPGLGVEGISQPELLVRPTKTVGVKSVSAVRRLPLAALLPEDELRWLADFVLDRQRRWPSDNRSALLFADPVSGDFRLTEPHVFSDLTRLLQQITGDESFRFHHLRHSFASLTLIKLMEERTGEMLTSGGVLQFDVSPDAHSIVNDPLWRKAGVGDTSMSLALLSQWLGHSSERVTLRSYAHLLDFLLGYYLRNRENPVLTIAQQQVLVDKTPAALERFRHRKRLTDRATPAGELLACVRVPNTLPVKGKAYPAVFHVSVAPPRTRRINPILPYRQALLVHEYSSGPAALTEAEAVARAAAQLDVDQNRAEAWQKRATTLFHLPTAKAKQRKRFSLCASNKEGQPEHFSLIFRAPELPNFPVPPQSKEAFKEMMRWFSGLADWAERDLTAVRESLRLSAEAVQRSRPEIQPRGKRRQVGFLRLIMEIRLLKHFELVINASEADSANAFHFWSRQSGLPKSKFRLDQTTLKAPSMDGVLHLRLKSPGKAGSNFWAALRFLIFSGGVIYDAVPGDVTDQDAVV